MEKYGKASLWDIERVWGHWYKGNVEENLHDWIRGTIMKDADRVTKKLKEISYKDKMILKIMQKDIPKVGKYEHF